MITTMRKVTLLCLDAERTAALQALRSLGVLHVEHRVAAGQPHSASAEIAVRRDASRRALGILGALHPLPRKRAGSAAAMLFKVPASVDGIVSRIEELHTRLASLEEQLEDLRFEREDLLPFGNFDPAQIGEIGKRGVETSLFRIPARKPFPKGEGLSLLSTRDGYHFGVAFGSLPVADGLEPVPLPRHSLSDIDGRIERFEQESLAANCELHSLATHIPAIEEQTAALQSAYDFQRVGESLGSHGRIADLTGYSPVAKVPMLQEAARKHGWALWIRDPGPEDNVPVALDLPRWLRPISVLFKGLGILPGYREADVSAVFLLFFSLFFAMLIGDAGYGMLMLLAVLYARHRKPKASAQPFWLFGVFAVATIVWGALTGNFFGIQSLPRFMQGIPWLAGENKDSNLMWFCFLIGGAHLTLAHLWNAAVLFPSRKALAQIGWIGVVWLMFFVAAQLVVGIPLPPAALWMGGVGVLLIVLFMTDPKDFKEEWINHPMLVLNLISCLVDVISYIRLFAVGMATAQIAVNFNQMAAGLPLPPWIKPLGVVLILVLGHGLNLALGALSILVHAVRLNTLEFSNHKGLTWSGQPYTPFRKNDASLNA